MDTYVTDCHEFGFSICMDSVARLWVCCGMYVCLKAMYEHF